MPRSLTANPGPWKNERTPYLAGIMDAVSEDGVERVVFLKGVQLGFSETIRNVLGYWIDHDPGPTLLVMPSEQSAKELVDERIRPLLHETPRLKRHASSDRNDNKVHHTRLDTMSVFIGWAGSPQALASRPVRYVVFDEVDKYPPFAGKEADPISLGLKRLTTYGMRARAIIGSTPTTRLGPIWREWEGCTQRRHFLVPCPHCGHRQRLRWDQVKWPARDDGVSIGDHAEAIEAGKLARYECEECERRWTDTQKNTACRDGEWVSEGDSPRRVGFHLNSIYSPWVSLSALASEFLRAKGDPGKVMDFANSRLAEPFEDEAGKTSPTIIEDRAKVSPPPLRCPAWTEALIATADVQKDHLWFAIRAWGAGGVSQLVRYGIAATFEELYELAFGGTIADDNGQATACDYLGIDARYRKDEVYSFAVTDVTRVIPVMGSGRPNSVPLTRTNVAAYPGLVLRTVNPNYWKDRTHALIHDDDSTRWLAHNEVGPDYVKQMASEHKIYDRKANQHVWQTISAGADNHLWDCEVMNTMMANECGIFVMTETGQDKPSNETDDANGWLDGHNGTWS